MVVSLGTGRLPVMPVETVDVFRPQNIMETYRSVRGFGFLGRILVEIATMSDGELFDSLKKIKFHVKLVTLTQLINCK